jgi:hypothetical protein
MDALSGLGLAGHESAGDGSDRGRCGPEASSRAHVWRFARLAGSPGSSNAKRRASELKAGPIPNSVASVRFGNAHVNPYSH